MADWDGTMTKKDDFDEEEALWSCENEDPTHSSPTPRKHRECSSPAWRLPRTLKRASNSVQQSSAPVSIPDWSKIYGKHHAHKHKGSSSSSSSSSWADNDHEMVSLPPHEWLARKLARTQVSSFSVCEGVGRTLKGRDLSKVRNAVLTKTGFLE